MPNPCFSMPHDASADSLLAWGEKLQRAASAANYLCASQAFFPRNVGLRAAHPEVPV